MQASDRLADRLQVDRALTVPPIRTEASLIATCSLLLGLTQAESRAFVKLVKHDHVTREEMHAAISNTDNPITRIEIVLVTIWRLRRKLALHDIKIINVYGQGYRLDTAARDKVREILAEFGENIISAAASAAEDRRPLSSLIEVLLANHCKEREPSEDSRLSKRGRK